MNHPIPPFEVTLPVMQEAKPARETAELLLPPGASPLSVRPQQLVLAQSNVPQALSSNEFSWLMIVIASVVAIVGAVMLAIPVFRGIGWLFGSFFSAIGWLIRHVFTFVRGMVTDSVRAVGAIIAGLFFVPLAVGNVVIGRWSAASHYGRAIQDEAAALGHCVYRVAIGHPARLLLLGGLTEGLEKRVPQAMQQAPGSDRPGAKVGQFDGYSIVGSLPTGGSGAKVYVAEPTPSKKAALARAGRGDLGQVVIKSFSLRDGSTMPQIVRESRALESARKLGLILDHELNDERFYYAMPFVPGDSLAAVTRRLHAEGGLGGLRGRSLAAAMSHVSDLLSELAYYHRGGLWHKDVKPDNIIVNEGKAHLVDLGLVTPLRSAMTLTTHGTEYFRDPELVRMALRGAKVNEVDGVKFDLYGVGAVLYSVIENSFPAHGALSQITKSCPEALRWIIRRSMADMHQRYSSADEMLADLSVVAKAVDPFALKPIDLPSMGGAGGSGDGASVPDLEPKYEAVSFARTTPPPVPGEALGGVNVETGPGFVFKADIGRGLRVGAGAGVAAAAADAKPAIGRTRPAIQLTDWWTGAYRVRGERVVVGKDSFTSPARRMPRAPGRTAAEQLQAARERVSAAQRRVQARPYRGFAASSRSYNNGPNAGVFVAVGVVLLVLGLVFFSRGTGRNAGVTSTAAQPEGFDLAIDGMDGADTMVTVASAVPAPKQDAGSNRMAKRSVTVPAAPDGAAIAEDARVITRTANPEGRRNQSGEEWLNAQVRKTKAILDARHADNSEVTFSSVASAAWEAFTSNPTGAGEPSGTEAPATVEIGDAALPPPATPAPSASPEAPASALGADPASEASAPGCVRDERVLLVSFVEGKSNTMIGDRQALMLKRLETDGYCVLGRGASATEVEMLAGAKIEIGTANPADEGARERLGAWLNGRPDLAAVLWISNDDRFNPRLVFRDDLAGEAKVRIRDTLSARR